MREIGIMLISTVLTCAVIGNAYYQRKQFYPTVVHITKSNPSMTVMYAQGLIIVFMINAFLRKIFFGTLRAAELEHLVEKVWYAVTETCLAFTVFRDDFSPKFLALFTLLLFLKSFHWLAEDRVDYMERSPVITWLFHLRVVTLLILLCSINMNMIYFAYDTTAAKGPSVQLVFGFEYAILLTVVFNIIMKYILHTIVLHSENPWNNKPVFLLYIELFIGVWKIALYVIFITVMIKLFTLPLFVLRPMYHTLGDFKKALHDIVMSRRAIRNMNTLYPDATSEELAAVDNVCIICREEMVAASKKLPCNHIFHTACLRSWFQRQQTCPTCRFDILRPTTNNPGSWQQNQQQAGQQAPPQPQARVINPADAYQFYPRVQAPGAAPQQPQPQQQQQQPQTQPSQSTPGAVPLTTLFAPPFPAMVPLPPMPTPPPNLTELSDDELRVMEGNLQEAVKARILTLQRVQLLLDAATAMMIQYQTAAATANIPGPTPANTTEEADLGEMREEDVTDLDLMRRFITWEAAKAVMAAKKRKDGEINSEQAEAQTEPDVPIASTSNESANTLAGTSSDDVLSDPTVRTDVESSSEQEMLRRRRLQKFSSTTE